MRWHRVPRDLGPRSQEHRIAPPSAAELQALVKRIAERIGRALERQLHSGPKRYEIRAQAVKEPLTKLMAARLEQELSAARAAETDVPPLPTPRDVPVHSGFVSIRPWCVVT